MVVFFLLNLISLFEDMSIFFLYVPDGKDWGKQ